MSNTAAVQPKIQESLLKGGYDNILPKVFVMNHDKKEESAAVQTDFEETELLKNLVRRSREGDSHAMGLLYEQFKGRMFSLAYRYTYNASSAEDLLQDIFIRVFTHLETLDKDEAFAGWMYRVAVNTCLSYLRSNKKNMLQSVPLSSIEYTVGENPQNVSEKMLEKPLEEAIQSLSTKLKSVFLLHDVQGFKHKEIAQMLGCTVGTSKSQLFKARMKVRQKLEKKQLR
ncbi:MAG: RNA polymerase sigma factor [Candidatus Aminicenantes bacterium]|nr:RNA polymerase sigma factor [Candidatus Aminicenantes bacterium]